MRITVCELPHEPGLLRVAWERLCQHTTRHGTEFVLLPECAFVPPLWESHPFDQNRWRHAVQLNAAWLGRLGELGVEHVVGTRPVEIEGRPFNQGFLWRPGCGVVPLRRKYFLPDEPGNWEATWFDAGDPAFPVFRAGDLSFGLNICSELWALETYGDYVGKAQVVLSPRATAAGTRAKWLAAGVVAAVRSGAFSISSNRVDRSGACGGGSWVISPAGKILAKTTLTSPFATVDVDLNAWKETSAVYPRYVFMTHKSLQPATATVRLDS